MAVGSNISLIVAPWTNGGSCTHESHSTVVFLVIKKKRGREDESYNISEVMSKEVKIKGEGHIRFYVVCNLCDIDNYY